MAALGAGALAFLACAAPEASPVDVRSTADLTSGSYQVVVVNASGRRFPSVWHLKVAGTGITGSSEWDCCPGHRVDKMAGAIRDEAVRITRFCTGQGYPGPCEQVYSEDPGSSNSSRLVGRWSGTGGSGTWTLYLDRVDIKFIAQGRGGDGYLLDDAQLLGGGKAVDLNFNNVAEKVTAVLALRLDYTNGTEVRASLRATAAGSGRRTYATLRNVRDGSELVIGNLSVFQSNAPEGRTRGCYPRVGQDAYLILGEKESGDDIRLTLRCSRTGLSTILWDTERVAVTLTPIHGHS